MKSVNTVRSMTAQSTHSLGARDGHGRRTDLLAKYLRVKKVGRPYPSIDTSEIMELQGSKDNQHCSGVPRYFTWMLMKKGSGFCGNQWPQSRSTESVQQESTIYYFVSGNRNRGPRNIDR